MKVTVTSSKTVELLEAYGLGLDALFDRQKLISILSPEDIFNDSVTVDKFLHQSGEAYDWLREINNLSEGDNYKKSSSADSEFLSLRVNKLRERFSHHSLNYFSSRVLGEDNLLIIMDETRKLSVNNTPGSEYELEPFRELLTNLIHLKGTEALSFKLIPLYIRHAAKKSIV